MRKIVFSVTAVLGLACSACSGHDGLYPVSGTVTYKGSPAAGAFITFHRRGGDARSEPAIVGLVRQDGSFELVCGSRGKGAPPGDYDVLIEWTRVTGPGRQRRRNGPDLLRGRYADRAHPRLHAAVRAERNALAAFELAE